MIANDEIGEVKYMRAGFTFPIGDNQATNIRMSKEKGGGSIYDIGCYAIHSIRTILQQEPETVHVHATLDPDHDVDVDAVTFMSFPNDVHASFDVSFHQANRAEYEVFGTEGKVSIPNAYRPDWYGGAGKVIVERNGVTRTETLYADQYKAEVEHISDVILGNDSLQLDMRQTLSNMEAIDACIKSIKNKTTVTL